MGEIAVGLVRNDCVLEELESIEDERNQRSLVDRGGTSPGDSSQSSHARVGDCTVAVL